MIIKNLTKNVIIGKNAEFCTSSFSKARGLMFSKKPKILIFIFKKEKIVPLHMFFVFFPIDALFLDKRKRIIEIKDNFMPFKYYKPKNKSMYIIELPAGAIKKTKTQIKDKISFSKR